MTNGELSDVTQLEAINIYLLLRQHMYLKAIILKL